MAKVVFNKGDLVWGVMPPVRGEGYPGPEVLGVVYATCPEGVWVEYPGGILCLFGSLSLESAD